MTRLSIKALTLIAFVFGISSQAAKADVSLTDGIRAFVCDGETLVLEKTDAGWVSSSVLGLSSTSDGWRWDADGSVYLSERKSGEWVLETLTSKGYQKTDCIDITASTAQVVDVTKSRISDNISKIVAENTAAKQQIAKQYKKLNKLSKHNADLGNQLEAALFSKNNLEIELKKFQSGVSELASKITAELIAPNVQQCWNVGSLSPLALSASVTVAFALTKDGKPFVSTISLKKSEAKTDEIAQEIFKSARRAIIRCGSQGFPMPDRVSEVTNVSIRFDAKLRKVSW